MRAPAFDSADATDAPTPEALAQLAAETDRDDSDSTPPETLIASAKTPTSALTRLARLDASYAEERDITDCYLHTLSCPLLSAEQEVALALQIRQGDRAAFNQMVEANLRLVVRLAKRYMNRGVAFLDLIAEGNFGLMHAVEKFNPDLGYRFSTYATWWIKQSIERGLLNQSRTVRVPIHVLKELHNYLRAMGELRKQLGREPSMEELAKDMKKPVEDVRKALSANSMIKSLDESFSDSDHSLLDTLAADGTPSPEAEIARDDLHAELDRWLDLLSPLERNVIAMRFGLRHHDVLTLEEVGTQLGITRERVRQVQLRAIDRLGKIAQRHSLSKELLLGDE